MFADIIFVKLCRIGFLIQAKRRKCDKIWGVVTVYFHVRPQRAWIRAVKLTLVAFVRLFLQCVFSNVCFKELAYEHAKSHWLHVCVFFLVCVVKCVFKWPAWEETKSHWLHLFDFSYETSKNLDQSSQTHTCCICLTFPRCVFSNVTSNCLPWTKSCKTKFKFSRICISLPNSYNSSYSHVASSNLYCSIESESIS